MKAKDLRCGNYVCTPLTDQIGTVSAIDERVDSVVINNSLCGIRLDDIQPIPLNEDWLLKLGFEKICTNLSREFEIDMTYYKKDKFVIYLLNTGFELEYIFGKTIEARVNMFKVWVFVHELQNLFHSLTGKELTIKELV